MRPSICVRGLSAGLAILLMAVFIFASPVHSQDPSQIRVALPLDYPPLSDENILGEPSGLLPDIWRLWSEKTGVGVEFFQSGFAETIQAVREDRVDVHGSIFRNEARDEWLSFTRPFHEAANGIYYRRGDGAPRALTDFSGQRVGVLGGTHQEGVLLANQIDLTVVPFEDVTAMLLALNNSEIDLLIHEDLSMGQLLNRTGLVSKVDRVPGEVARNAVFAAVKKDRPELLALLDWGFANISHAEYGEIERRWIPSKRNHLFPPFGTTIPLTTQEQEWLEKNRVVRVGMQTDWPPMASVDDQGELEGMSVEFLEIINKKLDGIITFVPGKWTELTQAVKDKRLDAIIDITPTRGRTSDFLFTEPYLLIPHVVVTRKGVTTSSDLSLLNGKTIAIERGFATVDFLRENYPEVAVNEVDDTFRALESVVVGQADAWIGNQAVAKYLIDLHSDTLTTLEIGSEVEGRNSTLTIGVRNDWSIFRNILIKAIIGITPQQRKFITEPWLSGRVGETIELSVGEQRWLNRFRDDKIRVLVEDWPPFNFREDGRNVGMALDYVKHAFDKLGLEAEHVKLSWPKALAGIRNQEKVDLIPALAHSPERAEFISFTEPYLAFPMVIFTRDDEEIISNLDDLKGKTVAIESDFIMDNRLADDYPEINRLQFDTTHHAIEAVSLGKANAYVGNIVAGTFHIQNHGYSNLKVAAPTKYANDEQAMGVRKDWPELASMLNKVLLQMTDEEHSRIRNAALAIRFDHGIELKTILLYGLPPAGIVLIIVIVIFITNRKLAERESWFKSLLESAPDATLIVDPDGKIVRVNRQGELMFGVDRFKLIGEKIERLVPDSVRDRHEGLRNGFVSASAPREMAANRSLMARRWDGSELPVEISLSPIETRKGTLISAAVRDVSDRRAAEAKIHEKDIQFTAALENMSGGLFMIDSDQIIRVFNQKFVDLYQLPGVKVGMPLRDVMMIRAARGDYGPGDPFEKVEERIEGYRDRVAARVEDHVPGGGIIESFREPTADGGMVCIFNDITERKRAEEALAEQTRKLETLSIKLSRYLSPQIYEAIFSGSADVDVRTERKKLTVFFSDIKNFTATTEEMEPEDMTYLLNDYLTKMTEIALEYGGTIDKYIGDAIMVFFGDPETRGVREDALAAVRMAVAMQRRMVDLRAKWADMGFRFPFHIRCGVNTGYCNVGNFGSEQRVDYTIIGGQVNLAARLESICPPDGVTVAHETYTLVRDEFDMEPMEPITVKGIRDPVEPYRITDVFENWDESERYIRRDNIRGLRVWVDLMRMSEEQRLSSMKELQEVIDILKLKKDAGKDTAQ